MCVYCMCADWMKDYGGPWEIPTIIPITPSIPWPQIISQDGRVDQLEKEVKDLSKKLESAEELIKGIKEMEDRLGGCPCEQPEKTKWIDEVKEHIKKSEEELKNLKELVEKHS